MADRTLSLGVDANLDKLVTSFERSAAAADKLTESVERAGKAADKLEQMSRAGKKVGDSLPDGRKMRSFVEELNNGDRSTKNLTDSANRLAAADQRLSEAEERVAAAARRVVIAEERLNEVRSRSRSSTSTVLAAEDQLAAARRNLADENDRQARSFSNYIRQLDQASAPLNRISDGLLLIGGAATAGLVASGKVALDWESAWAGVTKTVDGSRDELEGLEGELRQMARTLPSSHQEIAAVAEAAGQLGVKIDDVAGFTRVMIDLGETTNLSADEAATSLAQFMNVMRTAPEDVSRLGSTVVDLGNKGASTERQIVEMAQRISGAGVQIGLSESQVLGYASALSSVGVEVEAGGTAISTSFLRIEQAVRSGGAELDTLAATSGMSAREFADQWAKNPAEALNIFLQGLDGVQKSGGNATAILKDLGVTGTREADALRRLAASGDVLTQSLDDGAAAWENNSALAQEAAKRYATTESQIQISLNTIKDSAIDIGAELLPVAKDIASGFAGVAEAAGDLPQPVKDFAAQAGIFVAAAALIGGGTIRAVTGLSDLYTSMVNIRKESPGTAKAIGGVGKAVGVVGAVLVAAQVGSLIEKSFGENSQTTIEQFNSAVAGMSKDAKANVGSLDDLFKTSGSFFSADLEMRDTNGLDDSMRRLFNPIWEERANDWVANIIGPITGLSSVSGETQKKLGQLDQSLAYMASSGSTDQASRAFTTVSDSMLKQGASADEVIGRFSAYADQIRMTAREQTGMELSTDELIKAMGGDMPPVMQKQIDQGRELEIITSQLGTSREALETKESALTEALSKSVEQFSILQAGMVAIEQSSNNFDRALLTLNDSISENGKSLEKNRDASKESQLAVLDNRDAITGLIGSLNEDVTAKFNNTAETGNFIKAQKDASDALKKGRERILDSAEAAGLNRGEVKKMLDQMLLTPQELETKINAPGLEAMIKEIKSLKERIAELEGKELEINTKFSTNADEIIANFKSTEKKFGKQNALNQLNKDGNGRYSEGGRVQDLSGSGEQRYDTELAMLRVNEHVWTPEEVRAAGGHGAMEAMRAAALSGRLHAHYDTGGQVRPRDLRGRPSDVRRPATLNGRPDDRNEIDVHGRAGMVPGFDGFTAAGASMAQSLASGVARAYAAATAEMLTNAMQAASGAGVIDVNNPTGRTTYRGGTFSNLFAANLRLAEQRSGETIRVFQGGYRPATSYSGTSHAGDAIDLQVSTALIRALRSVGIAAWDRTGRGPWVPHTHAIPTPGAGYAAGSAVWQAQDYARGGDGLAAGGPVRQRANGRVRGPGGPTDDLVPIMASDGEYVLRAKAAAALGPGLLDMLNRMGGGFAAGGPIAASAFGSSNAYNIAVIVRLIRALEQPTADLARFTSAVRSASTAAQSAASALSAPRAALDKASRAASAATEDRNDLRLRNARSLAGRKEDVADSRERLKAAQQRVERLRPASAKQAKASSSLVSAERARDRVERANAEAIAKINDRIAATKRNTLAYRNLLEQKDLREKTNARAISAENEKVAKARKAAGKAGVNSSKIADAVAAEARAQRELDKALARQAETSRKNTLAMAEANSRVTKSTEAKKAAQQRYDAAADKSKIAADRLKESQQQLAQAQQEVANTARQMSDQYRQGYETESVNIADWIDLMRTGATDLGKFYGQVDRLRKLGLSETVIQQITGMGAVAGSEIAAQIIGGGKGIVDQLNKANQSLQDAADRLGYLGATGQGRYSTGGPIYGPGGPTDDKVAIRASNGEYLINARDAALNRPLLDMINSGQLSNRYFTRQMMATAPSAPVRTRSDRDINFTQYVTTSASPETTANYMAGKTRDMLTMSGLTIGGGVN